MWISWHPEQTRQVCCQIQRPLDLGSERSGHPVGWIEPDLRLSALPDSLWSISQINKEGILVILIVPNWSRRTGYTDLFKLLEDASWALLVCVDSLSIGIVFHPASQLLTLRAWQPQPWRTGTFQIQSSLISCRLGSLHKDYHQTWGPKLLATSRGTFILVVLNVVILPDQENWPWVPLGTDLSLGHSVSENFWPLGF